MNAVKPRNSLLPWLIGLVIIAIADLFVAYEFYATGCEAAGAVQAIILVVIPGVYLALMYLVFKERA